MMHQLARRTSAFAALLLLVACGAPKQAIEPTPTATSSPSAAPFRYDVNQLEAALPTTYGRHRLEPSAYVYPPNSTWRLRADPLAGRTVVPPACRTIIWSGGNTAPQGDFIAPATPSASASAELAPEEGGRTTAVSVTVVELTGELADRYLDMLRPTPAECAHVQVDGKEQASVVELPVSAFGDRARLVIRKYPARGRAWTEHILVYRTAHYTVNIRQDGYSVQDSAFLAFARQARDRLTAELRG